jgi:ferritin-like metal-binding protein YciE
LISALPLMEKGASSAELKAAFRDHLAETRQHKQRVEKCFKLLGCEVQSENCDAMNGLISEGNEVLSLSGDPDVKDAALIAAAQRVEHYEMAGYGCARTFARQLGYTEVADILQSTLDEEGDADKRLTHIAESFVNRQAVHS